MLYNVIPIVFGIDNKYVMPVCVIITSMEENKSSNVRYQYYILMSENINRHSSKMFERLKVKYNSINVNIIPVNPELLKETRLGFDYISLATYFRLFIAELLLDLKKCIYLDADTIVLKCLSDMYNIDISDYYIAGVRDLNVSTNDVQKRLELLGINDLDNYINAGILILNLQKIREDKLFPYFIEDLEKNYQFADQDILNKRCYRYIKNISLKYNVFNRYINNKRILPNSIYSENEIDEAIYHSSIIHFTGKHKPWILFRSKGCDVWWKYGNMFLEKEEIYILKTAESQYANKLDWTSFVKECDNSVIIWGFSDIGKALSDDLQRTNIKVVAFCDSDTSKIGDEYKGVRVISSEKINSYEYDRIIIASQRAYKVIEKKLFELGVDKVRIVRYIDKNLNYYLSLAPYFHKDEMEEIYVRKKTIHNMNKIHSDLNEIYCFDKWIIDDNPQ